MFDCSNGTHALSVTAAQALLSKISEMGQVLSRKTKRFSCLVVLLLVAFGLSELVQRTYGLRGAPARAVFSFAEQEFAYVPRVAEKCGKLCNYGEGKFSPSRYFDAREVPVDCEVIFSTDVFILRGHRRAKAPETIPPSLLDAYTIHGAVPISKYYFDQMYLSKQSKTHVWTKKMVDDQISLAAAGALQGNYGIDETNHLRNALRVAPGIEGGRVLVIGSEQPWVEACILQAGAKSITTLEYGEIISEHEAIQTLTPPAFRRNFISGELGTFDAIVTFSSVEHSGLGRYGDSLNPWGDILEIARAYCVSKPGASLVIGVMYGSDSIAFNAHRVYGDLRWPYLVSNWRQIHREDTGRQRVHVFQKPS